MPDNTPEIKKNKYFPIVRVPKFNGERENAEKLHSLLQKYPDAFKAVIYFDSSTHDIQSVSEIREFAREIQPSVSRLKALGYQTGINHLSTVGHHAETPNPELKDMDYLVTLSGNTKPGTLCPSSPKTLDYIASVYAEIALTGVDIIYSDDDLNYNMDCFCDICLAQFDGGNKITRSVLASELESDDIELRRKRRTQWLEYNSERANRIYRTIENIVHKISRDSAIGFMVCGIGHDGGGYKNWSESLRGENERVLCRPGGGTWNDVVPSRVLEKAHKIGRQICNLPDFVEIQSEIENFPAQTLNKSARFVSLEILSYTAVGCTGAAYSMSPFSHNTEAEISRHFEAVEKLAPFAVQITENFGGSIPCGVGYMWDGGVRHGDIRFDDQFYEIGIPACYNTEYMSVFLLNGSLAENMTENQIMRHLETGVMMDAEALEILNRRGFGQYTGFTVKGRFGGNIQEKNLRHALNGIYAGLRRYVPLEFAGHPDLGKSKSDISCAYTIEKSISAAEYLTECVDYRGMILGYGCGLFENELGGRVCVGGYVPFDFCYTEARSAQIKVVLKWLSKDKLPAYISSFGKTAIWFRNTTEGYPGVILSNISLDDAHGLEITLKTDLPKSIFTYFDGERIIRQDLPCLSAERGYKTVQVPFMPSLAVGYLIFKE